ncbi:MAG TPA: RDD family protein [Dehalococcoidia bacterium]|nr:RDD family protein [Dehalococcoidia bacterium]
MSVLCYKCGCTLGELDQYCQQCNTEIEMKAEAATAFAAKIIAKPCPECMRGASPNASTCSACGYDFLRSEPRPLVYASLPRRFGAAAIDFLLVALPLAALWYSNGEPRVVAYFAVMFPFFYCLGFWAMDGATPGKAAFGLRVVTITGEPMNPIASFVRYTGYLVSAVVFMIGFLLIFSNKEHRAFHDYWAGSVVVKSQR